MIKETTKIWVCYYIFHNELDHVIVSFHDLFFRDLSFSNKIHKFFFIRYGQGGNHVRLRILCDQNRYENINSKLLLHFTDFNLENIRRENYTPEVYRYGGEKSMIHCESQFELSSKTVIELLKNGEVNNHNVIFSAISLHILFLKSLNLERSDLIKICHFGFREWLPKNLNYINLVKLHFKKIEPLKERIHQNLDFLIEGIEEEESGILSDWYKLNNDYVTSVLKSKTKKINSSEDENYTYSILTSLIHMTNNRIGVLNIDEPLIFFILISYLKNHKSRTI